jgi:hypothetical protein
LYAFFAGYGSDGRNDPAFRYLLRMEIIKDWAKVPKDPANRGAHDRHRWMGIKFLSTFLF